MARIPAKCGRARKVAGCCRRDTTESGCLLSLLVWGVIRISLRHPVHTMTGTFYEAAENSRLRCDGLVRWRGSFALDSFAWLVPPVLNACTRIAVEMCPARSILRAVGYELAAAGMSQTRAARDRGETAESEENVIAGCCLLLMICNTDGRSWRRPRKPPKLSHWRRKVFPEMGRLRRSRERGWNFIVPSVHGGSTAEGPGTRRRRRRKGGSVDFSTPGSMGGCDALFYTKRSNGCPATRPSLTIGDSADHGPRGARRTPPRRPG
jgi:hypothetical protein